MACSGLHCCDDFNGFSPKAEEVSRNLFLKPGPASLARLFHLNLAREDRPMAKHFQHQINGDMGVDGMRRTSDDFAL